MSRTQPGTGHEPASRTRRVGGKHSSWFGVIPSAGVLFRAWNATEFVAVDYQFPALVGIAVDVLDAHHRYRAALSRLLTLPSGHEDGVVVDALTDSLHTAHRRLAGLINRIDDHLTDLLAPRPNGPATCHRNGLGTEISQLCRCWITATDPALPSRLDPAAHQSLFGQAVVYDLLAADVAAGRVHLPTRIPHRDNTRH